MIPEKQPNPTAALIGKGIDRRGKGIESQGLLNQRDQSVDPLATIHRIAMKQYLQLSVESEHGNVLSACSSDST
ncbi:hypothetical protein [Caballeronia sp.]|uniref:hypothetical protein n=1 Tax=Caballeronia sp. TaxID=1931223 RepID=UPI003C5EF350